MFIFILFGAAFTFVRHRHLVAVVRFVCLRLSFCPCCIRGWHLLFLFWWNKQRLGNEPSLANFDKLLSQRFSPGILLQLLNKSAVLGAEVLELLLAELLEIVEALEEFAVFGLCFEIRSQNSAVESLQPNRRQQFDHLVHHLGPAPQHPDLVQSDFAVRERSLVDGPGKLEVVYQVQENIDDALHVVIPAVGVAHRYGHRLEQQISRVPVLH